MQPETAAAIRTIAQQQSQIQMAGLPLTMYFGAAGEAAAVIEFIEQLIRERFPHITRIYIESRNRIDGYASTN